MTERVLKECRQRPLEPARIKQDWYASEIVLPFEWQGAKDGAPTKDIGSSILADLVATGKYPTVTTHQENVVASKLEEHLQKLESKFSAQQQRLENVILTVEKSHSAAERGSVEARQSSDGQGEKQELQAGRLQNIVAGMEQLLAGYAEEQEKAAKLAAVTRQELQEMRDDMIEQQATRETVRSLQAEMISLRQALGPDLCEFRGSFGKYLTEQISLQAAVEDLRRQFLDAQDVNSKSLFDCFGAELNELRASLGTHQDQQDNLIDSLNASAAKLGHQIDSQQNSQAVLELRETLAEQARMNESVARMHEGANKQFREDLQRLEEQTAVGSLKMKQDMSHFELQMAELRQTMIRCVGKQEAMECSSVSPTSQNDLEDMRSSLEHQLQEALGKLGASVGADIALLGQQLETQQQSSATASRSPQQDLDARVLDVEGRTAEALEVIQAMRVDHDARMSTVEKKAFEAIASIQTLRSAQGTADERFKAVEGKIFEAFEAVQATRLAHGDMEAKVGTLESESIEALKIAQATQATQPRIEELLEQLFEQVPGKDPSGASQIASMDEELDCLRMSLEKQQSLQSEVTENLWKDAGTLRERLEGQQGQLIALQQLVMDLGCAPGPKCEKQHPEVLHPSPVVPNATMEETTETPSIFGTRELAEMPRTLETLRAEQQETKSLASPSESQFLARIQGGLHAGR